MASEEDTRRRIFEYVRDGQKLKLCMLHSALKKEKISTYEICDMMGHYYPIKLFTINEAYESLRKEGFITYDSNLRSDSLRDKHAISNVFEQYRDLVEPSLDKNYPGKGDIAGTMNEQYLYLVEKLFIRGGSALEETLLSDIQKDIFAERLPSAYGSIQDFARISNRVRMDLTDLQKNRYVKRTPRGYTLPDFVFDNLLSDPYQATHLFSALSLNMWMVFDFEFYISNLTKIADRFSNLKNDVQRAVEHFRANRLNEALVCLNSACEELVRITYNNLGNTEKIPRDLTEILVALWTKEQDLCRDDPALKELGAKAGMLLGSLMFIPKWLRNKTSHQLVTPTADAVRFALASLLIATDIAVKLKFLD
jgi:DNA-binding transcriptional regulator YhcF (GntR family)